jgi:hypothetical protein
MGPPEVQSHEGWLQTSGLDDQIAQDMGYSGYSAERTLAHCDFLFKFSNI